MQFRHLTDEQWEYIAPLLPPHAREGKPRADDRRTINAILYILKTGVPWNDLPEEYGDDSTANRRLRRWEKEGVWKRIMDTLISDGYSSGRLNVDRLSIDSDTIPAKKGEGWSATTRTRRSMGPRFTPQSTSSRPRSPWPSVQRASTKVRGSSPS
jgi:transposase